MSYLFKRFISDEIVESKFQDKYGKDYKLKIEIQYQFEFRNKKMDIGFTKDDKAYWMFKFKDEYYMNIMDGIVLEDKYTVLDVYNTLMENAVASYRAVLGIQKQREEAIERLDRRKGE